MVMVQWGWEARQDGGAVDLKKVVHGGISNKYLNVILGNDISLPPVTQILVTVLHLALASSSCNFA